MAKFAAIQMTTGFEVAKNLQTAKRLIHSAVEAGAKCVILPEYFSVMGSDEQAKLNAKEPLGTGAVQGFLSETAKEYGIWLIGGTIPLETHEPKKVYGALLIYNENGERVGHYHKIHLFDVGVPGTDEAYAESGYSVPGDKPLVIDSPFGRLGFAVCYDIRFPEQFREMMKQGVEVLIVPAAFTVPTGKAHWEVLLRARAIENLCYLVASAQTGTHESGRQTYGHSMIVNPWGEIINQLPDGEGTVVADIDLDALKKIRRTFPALAHPRLLSPK